MNRNNRGFVILYYPQLLRRLFTEMAIEIGVLLVTASQQQMLHVQLLTDLFCPRYTWVKFERHA